MYWNLAIGFFCWTNSIMRLRLIETTTGKFEIYRRSYRLFSSWIRWKLFDTHEAAVKEYEMILDNFKRSEPHDRVVMIHREDEVE
jgi:hypothetical protein